MTASVPSPLADLRDVPLTQLTGNLIDEAVKRIIPDTPGVPSSAFNSAI